MAQVDCIAGWAKKNDRSLADLSADEWDAIPEVGDVNKKKKKDSYMPVPDSLLQQAQVRQRIA